MAHVYFRFLFVEPVSRTGFMISNWVEDSWVEICVQVLSEVFSDESLEASVVLYDCCC